MDAFEARGDLVIKGIERVVAAEHSVHRRVAGEAAPGISEYVEAVLNPRPERTDVEAVLFSSPDRTVRGALDRAGRRPRCCLAKTAGVGPAAEGDQHGFGGAGGALVDQYGHRQCWSFRG